MSLEERSNISRSLATAFRIGPPETGSAVTCSLVFITGPAGASSWLNVNNGGTFNFDSGNAAISQVHFTSSTNAYGFYFASGATGSSIMGKKGPLQLRNPLNYPILQVNPIGVLGDGNVSIGAPAAITGSDAAALYFSGTTKGFLLPRLTTAQRNTLGAGTEGLQVWDTDLKETMQSSGNSWRALTSGMGKAIIMKVSSFGTVQCSAVLPTGAMITHVTVRVLSAWPTGTTIYVRCPAEGWDLQSTSQNNPTIVGTYRSDPMHSVMPNEKIEVQVVGIGTPGTVWILVDYAEALT